MISDSRFKNADNFDHHAYVIVGNTELVKSSLLSELESSWKIHIKGNPDVSINIYDTLRIDDARELVEKQKNKSFSGIKKIFVIEANSIAVEAQNALLKAFEEPAENTHFFLIGNATKNLIPTLLSRVFRIVFPSSEKGINDVSVFLKAPISRRIEMIKKLSEEIKDEKKTKTDALSLIHGIEAELVKMREDGKNVSPLILEDLEVCREYMNDRSASVKMLLEYVALVMPGQK